MFEGRSLKTYTRTCMYENRDLHINHPIISIVVAHSPPFFWENLTNMSITVFTAQW